MRNKLLIILLLISSAVYSQTSEYKWQMLCSQKMPIDSLVCVTIYTQVFLLTGFNKDDYAYFGAIINHDTSTIYQKQRISFYDQRTPFVMWERNLLSFYVYIPHLHKGDEVTMVMRYHKQIKTMSHMFFAWNEKGWTF